jgi:hypothetical protein
MTTSHHADESAYRLIFTNINDEDLRNAIRAHLLRGLNVSLLERPQNPDNTLAERQIYVSAPLMEDPSIAIKGEGVIEYTARIEGDRIEISSARWITENSPQHPSEGGGHPNQEGGLRIAVSGTRTPNSEDEREIVREVRRIMSCDHPVEMILGGALGVDTIAIRAARAARGKNKVPRLIVIVPWTVAKQPTSAREWIVQCADKVVELDLPLKKRSYHMRNAAMLARADRLLAFWDGRKGGTSWTINEAR